MKPTRRYSTVPATGPRTGPPPARTFVSTISAHDASLLDVVDSLLNKGVVLNADVILALADVDLVYSALVGAALRRGPDDRRGTANRATVPGRTRNATRGKRAARKA